MGSTELTSETVEAGSDPRGKTERREKTPRATTDDTHTHAHRDTRRGRRGEESGGNNPSHACTTRARGQQRGQQHRSILLPMSLKAALHQRKRQQARKRTQGGQKAGRLEYTSSNAAQKDTRWTEGLAGRSILLPTLRKATFYQPANAVVDGVVVLL